MRNSRLIRKSFILVEGKTNLNWFFRYFRFSIFRNILRDFKGVARQPGLYLLRAKNCLISYIQCTNKIKKMVHAHGIWFSSVNLDEKVIIKEILIPEGLFYSPNSPKLQSFPEKKKKQFFFHILKNLFRTVYILLHWSRIYSCRNTLQIAIKSFYEQLKIFNKTWVAQPFKCHPTKWSNTLKQFVGCCRRIAWVFDHFVGLNLKGLMLKMQIILGILKWLLKVLAWKTHAKEDDRNIKEIQFNKKAIHLSKVMLAKFDNSALFNLVFSLPLFRYLTFNCLIFTLPIRYLTFVWFSPRQFLIGCLC